MTTTTKTNLSLKAVKAYRKQEKALSERLYWGKIDPNDCMDKYAMLVAELKDKLCSIWLKS